MFHDIFEQIDFEVVAATPEDLLKATRAKEIIVAAMARYQVSDCWQPQICRIIADALTAPVDEVGRPFVLGQLRREDRIHEVEFYYPLTLPAGEPMPVPGCRIVKARRCYIRGFVDLVFRHGEKFYIADWKSNRLSAGYGPDALADCMQDAGYHLQYKLYTVAVLRWLKQALGQRFDERSHFGGVCYFFIRGMGSGNGDGIFFVSSAEMGTSEDLESEITERLCGTIDQPGSIQ
jgi:exodeoxyribonuclease V beta subunit